MYAKQMTKDLHEIHQQELQQLKEIQSTPLPQQKLSQEPGLQQEKGQGQDQAEVLIGATKALAEALLAFQSSIDINKNK
jgi:hypothetical protein